MKKKIIWTDRYNGKYPNPKTVCKGQCEGLGVYPDLGIFIKCERCNGTGIDPTNKKGKSNERFNKRAKNF